MKKIVVYIFIYFLIGNICAQVPSKFYKHGEIAKELSQYSNSHRDVPEKVLPFFNKDSLILEDKMYEGLDIPFRFGKGFDVNLSLKDGKWKNTTKGRIWNLKVSSSDALSINFVFSDLYLPEEAELYIYNKDGTMLYGPVTSKQNSQGNLFLTDLIKGSSVILDLFEPKESKNETRLNIKRIVHAYRDINSAFSGKGISESCNVDVSCYPNYSNEADAVALVLLATGDQWCSGSVVNNTAQDFRSYFLTAFHCVDTDRNGTLSINEISTSEMWMFKFKFRKTSCNGSVVSSSISFNSANFRAGWYDTDFALMELNDLLLGDDQFTWLGWDRTGTTPTSGACIHHPNGDTMKISIENDSFSTSSWNGTNNHWLVNFDIGVVQHVSSGSPIMDNNDRVVGQLHGNQNYNSNFAYCDQPRAEFGRFNLSWGGGGTNTTRLSNWLDNSGTGTQTTNTLRSPYISGLTNICSYSNTTYTINLPEGASANWSESTTLRIISGQGTPTAIYQANRNGTTQIRAVVTLPTGQTIDLVKDVYVGTRPPAILLCPAEDYPVFNTHLQYGYVNEDYYLYAYGTNLSNIDADYKWRFYSSDPFGLPVLGSGRQIEYKKYIAGDYRVSLQYDGVCGWSDETFRTIRIEDNVRFSLSMYPNPTIEETTLSIETDRAMTFDEDEFWDVEVYSSSMILKTKKNRIKGKEVKIKTTGWKTDIYFIRAKYKDLILEDKLIIK